MSILLFGLALILSYGYIGATIKFLDEVHDRNLQFRGRTYTCWVITASITGLVNFWIFMDVYTTALTLALSIGLLLMRKVDNIYFITIVFLTLPFAILFTFRKEYLMVVPFLVLVLSFTAVLDEVLHELAPQIQSTSFSWISYHRPIMKITVLLLPLWAVFTFFHSLAFWSFDIFYEIIAYRLRAFG